MKDKSSRIKMMGVAFTFALCIFGAFMIPVFVFKYEDRRTTNYDIHYAAEGMVINSDRINISEKLRDFASELIEVSYIYMDDDNGSKTATQDPELLREKAVNELVDVFLGPVYDYDLMGQLGLINEASDLKAYLLSDADCYITPMYIIRPDKKDVFIAWEVDISDDAIGEILLFVDDDTGKILSMKLEGVAVDPDIFFERIKNDSFRTVISEYYGMKVQSVESAYSGTLIKSNIIMNPDTEAKKDLPFSMNFVLDAGKSKSIYFNSVDESQLIYDINEDFDTEVMDD